MNKSWLHWGILVSSIAALAGCSGEGEKKTATPAPTTKSDRVASPAPKASPSTAANPATKASPVATTPSSAKSNFNQPLVAAQPIDPTQKISPNAKAPAIDVAAGLIPPTNPDDWTKTVSKGRPDPFATLTIQPIEIIPEGEKVISLPVPKAKSVAIKPQVAKTTKPRSTAIASNPNASKTNKASSSKVAKAGMSKPDAKDKVVPVKIASAPQKTKLTSKSGKSGHLAKVEPAKSLKPIASKADPAQAKSPSKTALRQVTSPISAIKPLPIKAEPIQARTLGISGVIEIDGRTQVILKLPEESFSRYVEVGDRVANGKVLVKRVEGEQSLSPIIVLEEVGIEVRRQIGEGIDPKSIAPNQTIAKPATPGEKAEPQSKPTRPSV